jgi:hypothetical protein
LPIVADPLLAPNLTPEMVESANLRAAAALAFIAEHDIKVVQVEQPRWSPTHGYVGTGDLIGGFRRLTQRVGLEERQAAVSDRVKLQLAAYKQAWEEEFPDQELEQRVGVNIDREGVLTHEVYTNETFPDDLNTFLALLEVWRWDRPNEWPAGSKEPPGAADAGAVEPNSG